MASEKRFLSCFSFFYKNKKTLFLKKIGVQRRFLLGRLSGKAGSPESATDQTDTP
jgi:hypothetical protein